MIYHGTCSTVCHHFGVGPSLAKVVTLYAYMINQDDPPLQYDGIRCHIWVQRRLNSQSLVIPGIQSTGPSHGKYTGSKKILTLHLAGER